MSVAQRARELQQARVTRRLARQVARQAARQEARSESPKEVQQNHQVAVEVQRVVREFQRTALINQEKTQAEKEPSSTQPTAQRVTTVYGINWKRDFSNLTWTTLFQECRDLLQGMWCIVDRSTGRKLYPPRYLVIPGLMYTDEYYQFVGEENPRPEEKDAIVEPEVEFIAFFIVKEPFSSLQYKARYSARVAKDLLYYSEGHPEKYLTEELSAMTGYSEEDVCVGLVEIARSASRERKRTSLPPLREEKDGWSD
jgi:hypothetical protein